MAVPFYCSDCKTLLDSINFEDRTMFCPRCSKQQTLPESDKTVMIYNKPSERARDISKLEIQRLHGAPTTCAVKKICENCKFDVMSCIHDTAYKFTLICQKCDTIY